MTTAPATEAFSEDHSSQLLYDLGVSGAFSEDHSSQLLYNWGAPEDYSA